MTKKVAIILSGCGVFDGSEMHEAVITFLALDRAGAYYQCYAPDIKQYHVINHLTGKKSSESRNVLVESARIARGEIKPITELKTSDYDSVIIPGGFGAAKNLSNFAFNGKEFTIQQDVSSVVKSFFNARKAVGLICISSALAGNLYNVDDVRCTIGNDPETAAVLEATGARHINCPVDDIVVDEEVKLVTTPAYMITQSISAVAVGIEKLVTKVLQLS